MLAGDWLLEADYRYFHADQFYFGTEQSTPPAEYFGQPLIINVQSIDVNVTYAVTDRLGVRLTVPLSAGSQSRFYPDTARHVARASGIGDVSMVATTWLTDPSTHLSGNAAVGAGLKMPTGRYRVLRPFFFPGGTSALLSVDQSIEPGDGGWGIVLQAQAFRRLGRGLFAYFTGSYLVAPGDQTSVTRAPRFPNVHYSEADVYSGRLGVSSNLLPVRGLSWSFGGRIDGIPYHDLVGKSDGFRRPGYVAFVDPGVTLERDRNLVTVSTPVRVAQRLATRQTLNASGGAIGVGDLAKIVLFVSYARRF